ncbi:MAG: hypothetical protein ACSHXI_21005, partial [Hoeflea sp.]|uniref:hypothetical protein n=1 Tax=Hoeflea sp. TaxID=1940281 RepID=UPI003EF27EC0
IKIIQSDLHIERTLIMKTLVSAALLTVLSGTSASFAIPPIPSSIDTGYSDEATESKDTNFRFDNDQAAAYKVDANGSLDLLSRDQFQH